MTLFQATIENHWLCSHHDFSFRTWADEGLVTIGNIFVREAHQRREFGAMLLREPARLADEFGVT